MHNSPLHLCPVVKQYVALDEGHVECASEHGCTPLAACPLARYFRPPAAEIVIVAGAVAVGPAASPASDR